MKEITPASYSNAINTLIVSANRLNSILKYLEPSDLPNMKEKIIELIKVMSNQLDYVPGDVSVQDYIDDDNFSKLDWFKEILK